MSTNHPFRARRTNPKGTKPEAAVTRPFDGISLAEERFCCEPGPNQRLRTVTGLPEPFDAAQGKNVYTRATWDSAVAGLHGDTVGACRISSEGAELPRD